MKDGSRNGAARKECNAEGSAMQQHNEAHQCVQAAGQAPVEFASFS